MAGWRLCRGCGKGLQRREAEPQRDFARRLYCDISCRRIAAERERGNTPVSRGDPLLRALIRYGLNNDGLPGLPANDLLRIAAELGVAA